MGSVSWLNLLAEFVSLSYVVSMDFVANVDLILISLLRWVKYVWLEYDVKQIQTTYPYFPQNWFPQQNCFEN